MRRSMFGDYYATSTDDDIGEVFIAKGVDPDDCFADVVEDGEGGYAVEIRESESGDEVVQTDAGLFANPDEARAWAYGWVEDVNNNF